MIAALLFILKRKIMHVEVQNIMSLRHFINNYKQLRVIINSVSRCKYVLQKQIYLMACRNFIKLSII
jgi:hypothetical protein